MISLAVINHAFDHNVAIYVPVLLHGGHYALNLLILDG